MKVIKAKNPHPCFECGKTIDYGVSKDSWNIFRFVCSKCMSDYISAFTQFLESGAQERQKSSDE